ncbi:MAG: hypothetical protein EA409_06720 [Saprospirales bacterium]|nr:MAG: hypothetical protein EA409_06720 [Saprospirales bacterium]
MLFPYALVLNHALFFRSRELAYTEAEGVLSGWINAFWVNSPFLSALFLVFILFVKALLINRMSIVYRLGNEINLFPGMVYIILVSFLPTFQVLSGLVIGQLFFIIGLDALFQTYKRHQDKGMLFNSGFWIGLASLFYTPYLAAILVVIVGAFILKPVKLKDWLLMVNGLLTPYLLVFTVSFALGNPALDIFRVFEPNLHFGIPFFPVEIESFVPMLLVSAIVLIVLVNYQFYTSKKGIRTKKNIDIIYWTLIILGLSSLFFDGIGLQHIIIISVPLALLLQDSILRIENQLTAEIVHLFILGALFFFQYQNFI